MQTLTVTKVLLQLSLLAIGTVATELKGSSYTNSMFARAVREDSTSPLFVLIKVRNDKSDSLHDVAMLAPLLLWAVATEQGLDYAATSKAQLAHIALSHGDRTFTFRNSTVIAEIKPQYSGTELADARQRIGAFTSEALRQQLGTADSALHRFYFDRPKDKRDAYEYALAHVLLEHGILVGTADRTGRLYTP